MASETTSFRRQIRLKIVTTLFDFFFKIFLATSVHAWTFTSPFGLYNAATVVTEKYSDAHPDHLLNIYAPSHVLGDPKRSSSLSSLFTVALLQLCQILAFIKTLFFLLVKGKLHLVVYCIVSNFVSLFFQIFRVHFAICKWILLHVLPISSQSKPATPIRAQNSLSIHHKRTLTPIESACCDSSDPAAMSYASLFSPQPADQPGEFPDSPISGSPTAGDQSDNDRTFSAVRTPQKAPSSSSSGLLPMVFLIHGGAFRFGSKDSHWIFSLPFVINQRAPLVLHSHRHEDNTPFVVFSVNYRLCPQSSFPDALEDVCLAFEWVTANAAKYGADTSRLIIMGDSAGANLASSLSICLCTQTPFPTLPFVSKVRSTGVTPIGVVSACGMLDVMESRPRFRGPKNPYGSRTTGLFHDILSVVCRDYIGRKLHQLDEDERRDVTLLASPLSFFEGFEIAHPLPPFLILAASDDPVYQDSVRLFAALNKPIKGSSSVVAPGSQLLEYSNVPHCFHGMFWRVLTTGVWDPILDWCKALV